MGEEGTSWEFKLVDHATESAAKIFGALGKAQEAIEKAAFSFENLEHASEKGLGGIATLLGAGAIGKGIELFAELAEKVAELGLEFAKEAIKAADYGRTTELVFSRLMGGHEQGEAMISDAKHLAQALGVSFQSVVSDYQKLLLVGENPVTLNQLVQAAQDFGRVTGQGSSQYVDLFRSILSKGEFGSRDLMMMRSMGINVDLLAKHLGHAGMKAHDLQALLKTPISAHEGIQGVLDTMREQLRGGPLGGLQEDVGNGVEGMITKIKNQWDFLLEDFGKTAGFASVLTGLQGILDMMKQPEFKQALDTVFTMLTGILKVIEFTIPAMEKLIHLWGVSAMPVKESDTTGEKLSKSLTQGFMTGLILAVPGIKDVMVWMLQQNLNVAKGPKGIDAHSPSKKYAQLGSMAAEGFSLGMETTMGGLQMGSAFSPQVARSGSSKHMNAGGINVTVHAQSSDPSHLAATVKEAVLDALTSSFEELSMEAGAV